MEGAWSFFVVAVAPSGGAAILFLFVNFDLDLGLLLLDGGLLLKDAGIKCRLDPVRLGRDPGSRMPGKPDILTRRGGESSGNCNLP